MVSALIDRHFTVGALQLGDSLPVLVDLDLALVVQLLEGGQLTGFLVAGLLFSLFVGGGLVQQELELLDLTVALGQLGLQGVDFRVPGLVDSELADLGLEVGGSLPVLVNLA